MSKVPCGGFKLDNNFLGMNENDELSLLGGGGEGKAYQQLTTDGDGKTTWEDRLAYEYTGWKDFVLNSSTTVATEITGFTMPPAGDTVTIKVNGVESVETVTPYRSSISGRYIGSYMPPSVAAGAPGWCIFCLDGEEEVYGRTNVPVTISLLVAKIQQIDEKYIPQDKNFVRPLSYYIDGGRIFKTYYNESGNKVTAIKCNNIKLPRIGEVIIDDVNNAMGIGKTESIAETDNAFFINVINFITNSDYAFIFGTNETAETAFAELAAEYGYTLTTKPTT